MTDVLRKYRKQIRHFIHMSIELYPLQIYDSLAFYCFCCHLVYISINVSQIKEYYIMPMALSLRFLICH